MEGHLKSMKREGVKNEALISPLTTLVSRHFMFRFNNSEPLSFLDPVNGMNAHCYPRGGGGLPGLPLFKDDFVTPAEKFLSKKESESHY
jgi:hypothetical protein